MPFPYKPFGGGRISVILCRMLLAYRFSERIAVTTHRKEASGSCPSDCRAVVTVSKHPNSDRREGGNGVCSGLLAPFGALRVEFFLIESGSKDLLGLRGIGLVDHGSRFSTVAGIRQNVRDAFVGTIRTRCRCSRAGSVRSKLSPADEKVFRTDNFELSMALRIEVCSVGDRADPDAGFRSLSRYNVRNIVDKMHFPCPVFPFIFRYFCVEA